MLLLRRVVAGRLTRVSPTTRRIRALSGWAVLLGSIGACGGTDPRIPTTVSLSASALSFTALGQTQQLFPSVSDQDGKALAGADISWSSSNAGVATVSPTGVVTAVGAGSANVTATSGSATATAQVVVVLFNIDLRFLSAVTPTQRQAFTDARLRWEAAITADLEEILLQTQQACGPGSPAINENIDDVVILVTLEPIDGPSGTVANAGTCWIRDPGSLPILGEMRLDTADLPTLESDGLLSLVILHEMGHVLGIGTLWGEQGLLADPSLPPANGTDPHFTGAQAINAFDNVGGAVYVAGAKVPVENTGGIGNADGHWRESVLDNELMTGFINTGQNPLSRITIASLADQGYAVDLAAADAYSLLLSIRAFDNRPKLLLKNDILRGPIRKVDRRGRVTGEFRR